MKVLVQGHLGALSFQVFEGDLSSQSGRNGHFVLD